VVSINAEVSRDNLLPRTLEDYLVLRRAFANMQISLRKSAQHVIAIALSCLAMAQPSSRTESIITAGNLDGMRWPNFSDYQVWLRKFYEPAGYAPAWLQGNAPTPQALVMIERFRNASQNGLEPEDYDASRWDGRLQALKGPDADPAVFDVALSVSTMRYVSDLHIG